MRYQCPTCLKYVRDKAFLGLLHVCATPEEVKEMMQSQWYMNQRQQAIKNLPPWVK